MAHYVTKQAILEQAGLSHPVRGETPAGLVNGSNKVFTVDHFPISDANYDDITDDSDVTARVNGVVVAVQSANADTGDVTLVAAPASLATVTFDYRYTAVSDDEVEDVRSEAQDLINERMDSVEATPYNPVPATIRKIAKWYAAALLLARDYGFNADTSETSKDGYKKMKMAEEWLEAYALIGGSTGTTGAAAEADIITDPDVFAGYNRTTLSYDDIFMRGNDECL